MERSEGDCCYRRLAAAVIVRPDQFVSRGRIVDLWPRFL